MKDVGLPDYQKDHGFYYEMGSYWALWAEE